MAARRAIVVVDRRRHRRAGLRARSWPRAASRSRLSSARLRPAARCARSRSVASRLDAGPTVFTMRWVFEETVRGRRHIASPIMSRCARSRCSRATPGATAVALDLFADRERIGRRDRRFAGAAEARGYLAFCARARRIYDTLEAPFMRAPRPSPLGLVRRDRACADCAACCGIKPVHHAVAALGRHFRDPRLRQLFGRYATYCGSSPFCAPATLMLVAHVEQEGVWIVEGGMHRIAARLPDWRESKGAHDPLSGRGRARSWSSAGAPRRARSPRGEVLAADARGRQCRCGALAGGLLGAPAPPRRRRYPGRAALAVGHDLDLLAPRPTAFRCCATTCSFRATTPPSSTTSSRAARLPDDPRSTSAPRIATTRGSACTTAPSGCSASSTRPPIGDTRPFTT